jgi:FXSXX-COOH protein
MLPDAGLESAIADLTAIPLGRLRDSRDAALAAALRRLLRAIDGPDSPIADSGDSERQRLD